MEQKIKVLKKKTLICRLCRPDTIIVWIPKFSEKEGKCYGNVSIQKRNQWQKISQILQYPAFLPKESHGTEHPIQQIIIEYMLFVWICVKTWRYKNFQSTKTVYFTKEFRKQSSQKSDLAHPVLNPLWILLRLQIKTETLT